MPIEKGTIKVVWVTKNVKQIHSRMFESIPEADKFGRTKKDYIMFKLIKHSGMKTFSWTLLPYGKHRLYTSALKLYRKKGKLWF